jgi:hypothetical protein
MEIKKQTAVEWLKGEIEKFIDMGYTFTHEFEKASAMEKEQHFESYRLGNSFLDSNTLDFKDYFEQYYNETYEK